MPDVSVAIPFRDDRQTLGLAASSVLEQSVASFELILLDDGSTDGSLDIARSIRDSRVSVVSDGRNLGLAARLNQATQLACAPFIARMDADDVMRAHRLEQQLSFLREHPRIDVLGAAAFVVDARGQVRGARSTAPLAVTSRSVLGNDLFIHPTIMFRREWALAHPYAERFHRSQDKELWCRTFRTSEFAKLEEPLLFYREGGSFNWRKYRAQKLLDARIIASHGPAAVGLPRTVLAVAAVGAKLVLYRTALAAGRADRLIARRSTPLTEHERRDAQGELDGMATRALSLFAQMQVA